MFETDKKQQNMSELLKQFKNLKYWDIGPRTLP